MYGLFYCIKFFLKKNRLIIFSYEKFPTFGLIKINNCLFNNYHHQSNGKTNHNLCHLFFAGCSSAD